MMRLSEVAERMREIADHQDISELHQLADQIRRRSPRKRAPVNSQRMTAMLADEIRRYAEQNPDVSQAEIGRRFNVNQGRVSECTRGRRA